MNGRVGVLTFSFLREGACVFLIVHEPDDATARLSPLQAVLRLRSWTHVWWRACAKLDFSRFFGGREVGSS